MTDSTIKTKKAILIMFERHIKNNNQINEKVLLKFINSDDFKSTGDKFQKRYKLAIIVFFRWFNIDVTNIKW